MKQKYRMSMRTYQHVPGYFIKKCICNSIKDVIVYHEYRLSAEIMSNYS